MTWQNIVSYLKKNVQSKKDWLLLKEKENKNSWNAHAYTHDFWQETQES